jgi:Holliday junction resolvase RusA-like endonuclease
VSWKLFCCFEVYGDPVAQPRPRAVARKIDVIDEQGRIEEKWKARNYDSGTTEGWKMLITAAASRHRPAQPFEVPVRAHLTFLFARPERLMKPGVPDGLIPHTVKPDRDNLDKAVLDALTQVGMWRDDCQVCGGKVEKYYHTRGGRPGVVCIIETYEGES